MDDGLISVEVTLKNDIHNVIGVSRIVDIELITDLEDNEKAKYEVQIKELLSKKLLNKVGSEEFHDEDENFEDEVQEYLHTVTKLPKKSFHIKR